MTSPKLGRILICDAGPLIVLGKVDRLPLLTSMVPELLIPATVWHEVVDAGGNRPPAEWVRHNLSGAIRNGDLRLKTAYASQVDAGEAEALALAACNPEACLLMDDARGRTIARANGFKVIGTLGFLVEAKRCSMLLELRPTLEALRAVGWHMNDRLIRDVLAAAGE